MGVEGRKKASPATTRRLPEPRRSRLVRFTPFPPLPSAFPPPGQAGAEGKAIYQPPPGMRSLDIPGMVFKSSVKFFLCPSAGFRLLRAQISWAHLEWPPLEHLMGRDEPGAASYSGAASPWEGTRWMVRLFCSRHWDTHLFSFSFLVSFPGLW